MMRKDSILGSLDRRSYINLGSEKYMWYEALFALYLYERSIENIVYRQISKVVKPQLHVPQELYDSAPPSCDIIYMQTRKGEEGRDISRVSDPIYRHFRCDECVCARILHNAWEMGMLTRKLHSRRRWVSLAKWP